MNDNKTHIYFVPGMAANAKIFEHIKLPEAVFETHYLEWEIPLAKESLETYALRMTKKVTHKNPILLGVSFGGILVQEMSRFIATKKVVVVSSVLHENEFPFRIKFAKKTKVYKLMPMHLFSDIEKIAKYAFGEKISHRAELYKKYLSVSDEKYLNWAIEQLVNWKQTQVLTNVVHIHGNKDKIFPVKYIKGNVIEVINGTHIMIINKYKWFNENLPELLSV